MAEQNENFQPLIITIEPDEASEMPGTLRSWKGELGSIGLATASFIVLSKIHPQPDALYEAFKYAVPIGIGIAHENSFASGLKPLAIGITKGLAASWVGGHPELVQQFAQQGIDFIKPAVEHVIQQLPNVVSATAEHIPTRQLAEIAAGAVAVGVGGKIVKNTLQNLQPRELLTGVADATKEKSLSLASKALESSTNFLARMYERVESKRMNGSGGFGDLAETQFEATDGLGFLDTEN